MGALRERLNFVCRREARVLTREGGRPQSYNSNVDPTQLGFPGLWNDEFSRNEPGPTAVIRAPSMGMTASRVGSILGLRAKARSRSCGSTMPRSYASSGLQFEATTMVSTRLVLAAAAAALFSCSDPAGPQPYTSWPSHGGGWDSIRYSRLDQINRENVSQLKVAWTYESGDEFEGSEMQCNPVVIDGVAYITTPKLRVCALNAATGEEIWSFYPFDRDQGTRRYRNRGVTYWDDGAAGRIYITTNK